MWDRKELKTKGKVAFKKNYWPCVLVALILSILTVGSTSTSSSRIQSQTSSLSNVHLTVSERSAAVMAVIAAVAVIVVIAILITIFIINPLIVGAYRFFVRNSVEEKASAGLIASAYKDGNFGKIFVTMFLRDLFRALWTLLFIIPGIVKSYSYRMVPYLLADHPEMSATEIITMSREMMNGHKWNAFVLDLSFIGWHLLATITCGLVGIFYVNPYVQATNAELYMALSTKQATL